ncbi:MAG: putative response regulatory protein [Desulfovibrio sp.]
MRNITVLVADDEATVRQYLQAVIRRENLPVATLLEADNGLDALSLAQDQAPDLVFLDIRMPGLDGLETAKRLMETAFPGKVVIVSAYSEFDYAQRALRAGATDYLLKPVKPADFAHIIHGVAETERTVTPERLKSEQSPQPGSQFVENRRPHMVRAVLAYIDANLNAPLRLEDIAKAVHVSPWHLSRTFKRLTGKSIADCVRETRIERAKEILLSADFSVTEIAGMVGFENAGYFATCFKQMTGASPSAFRKAREQRPLLP